MKANELKRGSVFLADGKNIVVKRLHVQTACSRSGNTSSARSKPATLNTGLIVQVPEYLTPGENIKVNTESGEYISRV